MNFFFGYKDAKFVSELTIPKFQNSGKKNINFNLYYAEINRTQWVKNSISYRSFYKKLEKLFTENYVLIQYGEFGFIHNKYAYAIVKSNLGSKYVNLGKITNLNLDKLNEATWNIASIKLHSEVYFRFFKP